jgi:hypothetical protein
MTEFTKDDIEYYRKQYALWTSRSQTTPEELHLIGRLRDALDEIERLQTRVAELEQEREQVCKWTKDLNSLSQVFGFDVYRYLSPHDKYDFIRDREIFTHRPEFCKDCGKRIKLAESEEE